MISLLAAQPSPHTLCFDGWQGADTFKAKVNIEVQLASELAIAAIEKNGGVVTTAFYDPRSLEILCRPIPFFLRGQPIPKRMLPPEALVPYYTDARNRGYLADPARFPEARLELAKKYGYILPDITKDELFKMLSTRKDPRQIFFGLAPGWVVNMADKKILKPTDEKLLEYYSSWAPSRGASGRRALEGVVTRVSHCIGSVCVSEEDDVFCVITSFFFFYQN